MNYEEGVRIINDAELIMQSQLKQLSANRKAENSTRRSKDTLKKPVHNTIDNRYDEKALMDLGVYSDRLSPKNIMMKLEQTNSNYSLYDDEKISMHKNMFSPGGSYSTQQANKIGSRETSPTKGSPFKPKQAAPEAEIP